VLHITNGDHAGGALQQAGFQHPILPWRDVLHEGPVRSGLALEALSRERASFIAEAGWGTPAEVREDFRWRDELLRTAADHDEVTLWFEHDLYDQLQLLQLLDWFASHPHPRLTLVCEAEYLGGMAPQLMKDRFEQRKPVSARQLAEGAAAWAAFTSTDPASMQRCDTSSLQFVGPALTRQLQEFPWTGDELSLLERNVVRALRDGALSFPQLFLRTREDPVFLGDGVLLWHLSRMESEGLIRSEGDAWLPISEQRARRIPRWLGGVVVDEASRWRWNPAAGLLQLL
jgi:hypothetical protein